MLGVAALFLFCFAVNSSGQSPREKRLMLDAVIKTGSNSPAEVRNARQNGANKMITLRRSVDLNGDGKPEYIVVSYVNAFEAVWVFQITRGGARPLYVGDQRSDITPLRSRTNGWLDLQYQTAQSSTGEIYTETLRYNGVKYQ